MNVEDGQVWANGALLQQCNRLLPGAGAVGPVARRFYHPAGDLGNRSFVLHHEHERQHLPKGTGSAHLSVGDVTATAPESGHILECHGALGTADASSIGTDVSDNRTDQCQRYAAASQATFGPLPRPGGRLSLAAQYQRGRPMTDLEHEVLSCLRPWARQQSSATAPWALGLGSSRVERVYA
jgi:hypothetical protein